jgi:hypothetical protein
MTTLVSTSTRTFRVKMLDSSGEFVLYIMAETGEEARLTAHCDWRDACFINVEEVL